VGRAFVNKLAAEGARDPEALAAWIGRQKHGRKAFQRLARAGAEREREQQRVMDRVRPGGSLAGDLTGFSDIDLGRALRGLNESEAARVATELDRRDVAANLPGARRDLIGVSDEELGRRLADADGAESAAIAAEMDRRQLLAEVFPGGTLAGDLSAMDEGTLGWALSYARPDEASRIAAEFDRREPVALPTPAATGDAVADLWADRAALDEALAPLPDPDGWGALADDDEAYAGLRAAAAEEFSGGDRDPDADDAPDGSFEERLARAAAAERAGIGQSIQERTGQRRITSREARELYSEYVWQQVAAAEEATNGYLFNRRYAAKGYSEASLFTGPARIAYARASDELREWWESNPRKTQAEFIEELTGVRQQWAASARMNNRDQMLRR
jgi:hypothetical protein